MFLISKKHVFHVQTYTSRNIPKWTYFMYLRIKDTRYTIHSGVPRWMLDKLKVNKIACKWRSLSRHCKRSRDLPLYDLLILISQSSDWKQRKEKNHTQYSFSNTYRCCINNTNEFATQSNLIVTELLDDFFHLSAIHRSFVNTQFNSLLKSKLTYQRNTIPTFYWNKI